MTKKNFPLLSILSLALIFIVGAPLLRAWVPQVPTGQWTAIQPDPEETPIDMLQARDGAVAVPLQNGRVLIAGGVAPDGTPLASVEFLNLSGDFSAGAPMKVARLGHTATLLSDGRVLVAGGTTTGGEATASVEVYNPQKNTWTVTQPLQGARSGHTATLIDNNFVVITGGAAAGVPVDSIEMYDAANGRVDAAGSMGAPRAGHAAAKLSDGKVAIFGGFDGTSVLATTKIFDPDTLSMTAGPGMPEARAGLTAVSLLDGSVLLVGGTDGFQDLASLLRFDGAGFTGAGSLSFGRQRPAAILLPHNNSVLIFGGTLNGGGVDDAVLYRPWSNTVVPTGLPGVMRATPAAAPTAFDGALLAAGGDGTNSAQLYGYATVKTDKDDYFPGEPVTVSGSGWVPGETVTLALREVPYVDEHPSITAQVQADGTFVTSEFAPDDGDFGIMFYLTAYGLQSEAETRFTDGGAKIDKIYRDAGLSSETETIGVGDTLYAAAVSLKAAGSYRFRFLDAAGTQAYLGPCFTGVTSAVGSYAPTTRSTATPWTVELLQWDGSEGTTASTTCSAGTGAADGDNAKVFYVAQATAYTTPALSVSTAMYGAGATAYVVVQGLKISQNDWQTIWLAPGVSCANTAGGDRPDSDASGSLTSAYLAYQPANTFVDASNKVSS